MYDLSNQLTGYPRSDGKKGIRNILVVVYLVECVHFVADEIASYFKGQNVHVIGFGGCYPNAHAEKVMNSLCTHPNVGAVLFISLGCESFNKKGIFETVKDTNRFVNLIITQKVGGTKATIKEGKEWVYEILRQLQKQTKVPMSLNEVVVGTICGGSDATSGLTANPAVGKVFDKLVKAGCTVIFEETGEMVGLENQLAKRAVTKELGYILRETVIKAAKYYSIMGHGSFAPGNSEGGLTTIEEKSIGAYSKSGHSSISGLLKPGDIPTHGGLYLLDVVPDGDPMFGFPNINDNAEISELMACGCHIILFTTGRGSIVGSAIAPVIKICANPQTYEKMKDDMDINAGKIISRETTMEEVVSEIIEKILNTVNGHATCSEELGHQEFVLSYKRFERGGPACLP